MDTAIKANRTGFWLNVATGAGLLLTGLFVAYGIATGIFRSQ